MNKIKIFHFLLLLCLFPSYNYGQKKWSLQDCINYAVENNISVKRKQIIQKSGDIKIRRAKNNILPDLNFGISQNFDFGNATDLYTGNTSENFTKSNNFYLLSSVVLFDGFYNFYKIKQNKIDLLASLQEIEAVKYNIRLNVLTAYLQILLQEEELKISENQFSITELQLENAKQIAKQKIISRSDVLEIESQVAYEKYLVTISRTKLTNALLALLKLLEIQDTNISIQKPRIKIDKKDLLLPKFDIIYEKSKKLPYIKSAEYQLKGSLYEINIIQSLLYPKISLKLGLNTNWSDANYLYNTNELSFSQIGFVGNSNNSPVYTTTYNTKNYSFANQLKNNVLPSISINLSYSVFDKFAHKTNKEKAILKIADSKYFLQQTKNKLFYDIKQVYLDINNAIAEYENAKKYLKSIEITFKNTKLKLSAGKITAYDYNIAKNKLIKAKINLTKTKYEIKFKQNILRFYQNLPFKL